MSNNQKKKNREREVKKKLLDRRMQMRAKAKEERELAKVEQASAPKPKPICGRQFRHQTAARKAAIKQQVEQNIEILKKLKEQYDKEYGGDPVNTRTISLVGGTTDPVRGEALNKLINDDAATLSSRIDLNSTVKFKGTFQEAPPIQNHKYRTQTYQPVGGKIEDPLALDNAVVEETQK